MYFLRPRGKGGIVEDYKVLNPNIWSSLPDDLVEKVLSKLPFSTLVNCRVVCKKWNELILSENFIPLSRDSRKCVPFHFTFYTPAEPKGQDESRYFTVFDPGCNSWVELSLSFLKLDPEMGNWEMAASGGGLLCLASICCSKFLVCNPLTKKWRLLEFPFSETEKPLLALPRSDKDCDHRSLEHLFVGLVVNQETGNYMLVVAEIYRSSKRTTLVYDSKKRVWGTGANTPFFPDSCYSRQPGVSCSGALYWISDDEILCRPRLFKYDVEKDSWSSYLLSAYRCDIRIIEHMDELFVMTGHGDACRIAEYNSKLYYTSKRMPRRLVEKLHRQHDDGVQNSSCIGAGGLVCFVREVMSEGMFRTRLEFFFRDFANSTSTITANLGYGYVLLCWVIEPSLTAKA